MKHICLPSLLAAVVVLTFAENSRGASVTDSNIFNNGITQAAQDSTSLYGGFSLSSVDDRNGDNLFFFADVGVGAPEMLSLSGFNASAGIDTLRFYGQEEFEIRRVPLSVTIYTSSSNLTGAASLNEGNYTLLGTFALPATPNVSTNHAYYTTGVDSSGGDGNFGHYDDLTGLGIAAGTQSILFDFGPEAEGGRGLSEIQGFAAVPEPSTYAMMFAGVALLGFVLRRKTVRI